MLKDTLQNRENQEQSKKGYEIKPLVCLVMESLGHHCFSGLEDGSSHQVMMVENLWPSLHGSHHRTAFVESAGLQLLCRPEHFPPEHQTKWDDNCGHTQWLKRWQMEMLLFHSFSRRHLYCRQGHSVTLGCHISGLTRWNTTPNPQTAALLFQLSCMENRHNIHNYSQDITNKDIKYIFRIYFN